MYSNEIYIIVLISLSTLLFILNLLFYLKILYNYTNKKDGG